jgi:hypothetical protein
MRKTLFIVTLSIIAMALLFSSCAMFGGRPSASNFEDPMITLESFMVPQYDGFWFYGAKSKPALGKAGNHGAPLPMTFLFNIKNPNDYPVMLDGYQFTVAFEGFDLVTVNNNDESWIPPGATNQVRATTMITVRSAQLSLLVAGGFKLKAKKMKWSQALEKWWTGIPDFSVPVTVHEGAFSFSAGKVNKVIPFKATFP